MKKIAKWFEHFDYKWVIVAVSFMMVFTVLGFCSSANSIFIKPICDGLDVPRSAYSLTVTFRYVATTVMNLFFGFLVAKFGMKKLMLAGFVSLTAANVIFAFTTSIWGFYIGSFFLGLGFAWTTTTMAGAIVSKWCKHNKGTIMGIILAANGIGASVAVQILSPIINSGTFGFRAAYRLTTVIVLAVGVIVLLLFKDKPWHTFPDSPRAKKVKENPKRNPLRSNWSGIPYSDALKKPYFYCAAACVFLTAMTQQNCVTCATPNFQDLGFDEGWVSMILSLSSILFSCTKILVGYLYDRFGLRVTTTLSYSCLIGTQLLLLIIDNSPAGKALSLVYCFVYAVSVPLDTVMIPIISGDLFGEHSYAKILGIIAASCTVGCSIGSPVANFCYDIFGSYKFIFTVGLVCASLVLVTMQFVISQANKEKAKCPRVAEKTAEIAVK